MRLPNFDCPILLLSYAGSRGVPSTPLVKNNPYSEYERQNNGVQHTKHRSTIGKVQRYFLFGTMSIDNGRNVKSCYSYYSF